MSCRGEVTNVNKFRGVPGCRDIVLASQLNHDREYPPMKLAVMIGILGVLLGYFVGRGQSKGRDENAGPEEVVRSSRGLEGRRTGDGGRDQPRVRTDVKRRALEVGRQGEDMTELSKARLIAWIMRLESGDFPDVLDDLAELGSFGEPDPFYSGSQAEYLKIGLCRWYELEGEMVLDWILRSPPVLEGTELKPIIGDLLTDQFERDAGAGLETLKRYAEVLADHGKGIRGGLSGQWRYLVGRWSRNPMEDFAKLVALEEQFGVRIDSDADADPFDTEGADPFGSGQPDPFDSGRDDPFPVTRINNALGMLLLEGLVNGGRLEEARDYCSANFPEDMDVVEEIINERAVNSLKSQGWRDLKEAIDSGRVEGDSWDELEVFRELKNEDPDEAVRWFLELDGEESKEGIRVASLVGVGGFLVKSGGTELEQGTRFLNGLEEAGETVDRGWEALFDRAMNRNRWDDIEAMRERVSEDKWQEGLKAISEKVLTRRWVSLGGESIYFWEFDDDVEEVIQQFGLEDRLMKKVEEGNRKGLQTLNEILGTE